MKKIKSSYINVTDGLHEAETDKQIGGAVRVDDVDELSVALVQANNGLRVFKVRTG
jgi:hypothetical protein